SMCLRSRTRILWRCEPPPGLAPGDAEAPATGTRSAAAGSVMPRAARAAVSAPPLSATSTLTVSMPSSGRRAEQPATPRTRQPARAAVTSRCLLMPLRCPGRGSGRSADCSGPVSGGGEPGRRRGQAEEEAGADVAGGPAVPALLDEAQRLEAHR